jgi:hypothetical protein
MQNLRSSPMLQKGQYVLPALASGLVAGIVFSVMGETPILRSAGLAATIVVIGLTLQRFGGLLAFAGSLALAFSPAFWSQTGGGQPITLTLLVTVLVALGLSAGLLMWIGQRRGLWIAAEVVIGAVIIWELFGTSRSLRLTTFLNAGLIYLLIDALLTANPRPDESVPTPLQPYHIWGLLTILALGVLNDPLFSLNIPAVILGLTLSKSRLPRWYWGIILLISIAGLWGIAGEYLSSTWWTFPAAQAESLDMRVPYMMADGWREASRWLELFSLVINQFTVVGLILGAMGLARLARWYPPLGVVTMVDYATYGLFGLVYFGADSAVLLLPLLMIQVVWMAYAVHTFSQWLQKSLPAKRDLVRWAAPAVFILLPVTMLLRIAGVL